MEYLASFMRYEIKYMLSTDQKQRLLDIMKDYMRPDEFGHTEIRNIYYDTPDFRLVRRSREKPVYKEKLRVRSYGKPRAGGKVFVELKKKYRSVVYKRRTAMPLEDALGFVSGDLRRVGDSQIEKEIGSFIRFYRTLRPAAYLSYERDSFFGKDDGDLRITFDEKILARTYDVTLDSDLGGEELLRPGTVLMEVKCGGAMPLWLVRYLSREHIYQTSFSKYGEAYEKLIFNCELGRKKYA
ncbi:MAG: polyphosphate polymerase domain-containing protein [Oscillospiraceae bacterium]|nr:polyphosphate polymerase domain-containing protein [Oscillospiraceae bacterium]